MDPLLGFSLPLSQDHQHRRRLGHEVAEVPPRFGFTGAAGSTISNGGLLSHGETFPLWLFSLQTLAQQGFEGFFL